MRPERSSRRSDEPARQTQYNSQSGAPFLLVEPGEVAAVMYRRSRAEAPSPHLRLLPRRLAGVSLWASHLPGGEGLSCPGFDDAGP